LVFLGVFYLLIERGIHSPWGRVLRAIREDEVLAAAYGKNVYAFKLQAMVLGAMLMGAGGALYGHYAGTIQPGTFEPLFGTFIIWVMLVIGGTGNNKGAILGAFVVWTIWGGTGFLTDLVVPPLFAARAPYIRFICIGVLLILMLLFRPRGLIGEAKFVPREEAE
jgi:branched-chain amino acid transport system permease protein